MPNISEACRALHMFSKAASVSTHIAGDIIEFVIGKIIAHLIEKPRGIFLQIG
jgi:hypothetical protein